MDPRMLPFGQSTLYNRRVGCVLSDTCWGVKDSPVTVGINVRIASIIHKLHNIINVFGRNPDK